MKRPLYIYKSPYFFKCILGVGIFALFLLFGPSLFSPASSSPTHPTHSTSLPKSPSTFISSPLSAAPQAQSSIQDLITRVEQVGKLKLRNEISVRFCDREFLEQYINKWFDREYPDKLSHKEGLFLWTMGFTEPNKGVDVKQSKKRILLSNIYGVYNEKTKELLALNRYRSVDWMNAMVLIHELRHAVQDDHFDIAELLKEPKAHFDDRKLAILAALEGDATFLMVKCNDFDPDVLSSSLESDPLISFSPLSNTSQLYKAPQVIKQQMVMPYIKGVRFVNGVFRKKKWRGVNRILNDPPVSTEQILHPEKYLKKELPLEVEVLYQPEGYSLFHSGVIGEFLLNLLIMSGPSGEYNDYAIGWGGDAFHLYTKDSFYFLVWKSVWDKESYSANFYFDLKRFIEKKFDVKFKNGNVKGTLFIAGHSPAGYFFLKRLKDRIIFVRTNNRDHMNKFIFGGNYD